MNFNEVSKNAKILTIGQVEPKLRKIRQIVMGETRQDFLKSIWMTHRGVS